MDAPNPYAAPASRLPAPPPLRIEQPGGWVRWLMLAAGTLFGLFAPLRLLDGNFDDALACLLIAAVAVGGFFAIHQARTERAKLLKWLHAHATDVWHGTAVLEGKRLLPTTNFRSYSAVISLLFFTTTFSLRLVREDDSAAPRLHIMASLTALVFGWWSFPWGPIRTLMAVVNNARGGTVVSVGALLLSMGISPPQQSEIAPT